MVQRYQPQSALKPKSTKRVRQFRERQQKKHAEFVAGLNQVPAVAETTKLTDVRIETSLPNQRARPETRPSITITTATFVSALALAGCSGYFSISGLTAIFAGAYWPVVGLGIALEAGKLSSVAWLGRPSPIRSRSLRTSLVVLVGLLMALNSIGVYGFLARAHIEHGLASEIGVDAKAADINARIKVQANTVSDLDRRITQIDAAIDAAIQHGRTNGAMDLANAQKRNRAELSVNRIKEANTLADLQVEAATVQGERKTAEADLGPVRYLAQLMDAEDEAVMRYFILAVALILDPAAVLLLLAATSRKN